MWSASCFLRAGRCAYMASRSDFLPLFCYGETDSHVALLLGMTKIGGAACFRGAVFGRGRLCMPPHELCRFNFQLSVFHFQLSPLSYPSGGAHTIAADKGLFLVRNFCGKEVSPREHEDRKQLIKKSATPDKTALRSRRNYLQRETEMVRCN